MNWAQVNRRSRALITLAAAVLITPLRASGQAAAPPKPPGVLVDIGGQLLHVTCTGSGSPTVLLEAGLGDFSFVWSLVQPGVARITRACSYDRGGYAWSEPGTAPRTFAQLALELHTALGKLGIRPPYVLVGQSYGGLVIRGFAEQYRQEVAGVVMVDAVHEDQRVVYGGQPHRIRDCATGRPFPAPRISLDTTMIARARAATPIQAEAALEPPLNRLPEWAQTLWRWADMQPMLQLAQAAETDWSPEESARMHEARLSNRASLDSLPLIVLARTHGGYDTGMSISADSLERERRSLAADLARLSSRGKLIYAPNSGHNIHLDNPALVISAIQEVVGDARRHR